MIRTTFRLALRSFRSNKLIAMGSVLCLFLGTLSTTLMVVYLRQVLEKDDFNSRKKNIYLAALKESPLSPTMSVCASDYLGLNYRDYPGIETSTFVASLDRSKEGLSWNGSVFHPQTLFVDSNFFKVFDYRVLVGDKQTLLSKDGSMVLTERIARKLFGSANPVGKTLEFQKQTFTVEGVVENTSANSSISFDVLIRMKPEGNYPLFGREGAEYLLTSDGFDARLFNRQLNRLTQHNRFSSDTVFVLPFEDAYVKLDRQDRSTMNPEVVYRSEDRQSLWMFISLVLVVLIITVLNYSTLQRCLDRSEAKSLGIHRLIGATTTFVWRLQSAKSFLLIGVVGLLTLLTFYLLLPLFNQLAGIRLYGSIDEVVITVLSILVPVVIVGWIKPRHRLQPSLKQPSNAGIIRTLMRKSVLVLQFALSITLIFVTLVVTIQWNWMMQQHTGMDIEGVVRTNLPDWTYNDLDQNTFIESYSSGFSPFKPVTSPLQVANKPESLIPVNGIMVEPGYEKVFGLKLKEGRFFDLSHEPRPHDYAKLVINEAAKKAWKIQDISTERLSDIYGYSTYEIIGVVEDVTYQHLAFKPKPLALMCIYNMGYEVLIRFKNGSEEAGLASLKKLYNEKVDAKGVLEYTFIRADADNLYQQEKQLSRLCLLFMLTGLLITLVGLYTLVNAETQRRVKEIGIRRVNGAGIPSIMLLLQSDLIQAFAVSFVLSCPIGWLVMHRWLEHFAYHIPLSWWLFALAGLIAFVVALLTVSGLSWKAATRNPVESLRYE